MRRDSSSVLRFVVAHVHWLGSLGSQFSGLILNLIDATFDVGQLLSTDVAREQLGLLGQLGQTCIRHACYFFFVLRLRVEV